MFKNYKNKTEDKLMFYKPFACFRITSGYGWRRLWKKKRFHKGVDMVPIVLNTSILSIGAGVVDRIIPESSGDAGGNIVVVKSTWYHNVEVKYMHLEKILVDVGQKVTHKTLIGTMGNTGKSTGSHLHLGIWHNGKHLNPFGSKVTWLPRKIKYL